MDTYCTVSIYFPCESGLVQCSEFIFHWQTLCAAWRKLYDSQNQHTKLHTGVNNGLRTASQTPPGISRHIKQWWGLGNKESLPVSIGNMGMCTQETLTNKCLALRGDKGQLARFLLLVTTWFCIKIWTIRHSDCPRNFNWKMFWSQGSICQLCVIYLYFTIPLHLYILYIYKTIFFLIIAIKIFFTPVCVCVNWFMYYKYYIMEKVLLFKNAT